VKESAPWLETVVAKGAGRRTDMTEGSPGARRATEGNCLEGLRYVQYGSGHSVASGWESYDASPTLRLERLPLVGVFVRRNSRRFPKEVQYGDIARGLPIASGSCAGIYCSHVLEHLALDDFRAALVETRRLIAIGGRFRLIVPDLRLLVQSYRADSSPKASLRFNRQLAMGCEHRARGLVGRVVESLGNGRHRWMWDEVALRHELQKAGFSAIRRCWPGDCPDPMFLRVEDPGRYVDAIALECQRTCS